MASLNCVHLIGNMTSDPQSRKTNSGQDVSTCSIAVNEKFKDKDGNQKESVEFVNLVFWRRQSQILNQYCKKGASLYIQGKLQTQSWDDPQGQKRYKTEIVVSNFQMLSNGKGGSSETKSDNQGYGGQSETPPAYDQSMPF
jgi:single-strand DNA-binding protein